ncbi:MAG: PAS domain-containing sensor histidine kinase [Cellulomonadaceae bacterium]|jgi:two-component sensor histidine kinase/PAS domain-containing protein|nr:PAS domain-containing sensor histidine kinase [Cellulomonadaceae bacterium]
MRDLIVSVVGPPVANPSDLPDGQPALTDADIAWLQLLTGDWQVIADLAFSDLVLWVHTPDGGFIAVNHCRPATGATVYYDDIVGSTAPAGLRPQLQAAIDESRPQRARAPRWFGAYAVREEAVPVVYQGRPIAIITRQTNLGSGRTPSRLELNFVEASDDIMAMIGRSEYPIPNAAVGPRRGTPRVGDGVIRLNSEGEVLYASPNALSSLHRLGIIGGIIGESLLEKTSELLEYSSTVDEAMPLVLMGRAPWRSDIENRRAAISVRALPLTEHGQRIGAVLLCRDISDLRRQERDLMTKDATIREIHHRVKNNLATVAALLRLQSRRVDNAEAKEALNEATRRVSTISLVHELLAQTLDEQVELDDMMARALRGTAEVASTRTQVRTQQSGTFGKIPAENATPLALVLTELVTNAVEHGFSDGRPTGTITIDVNREGSRLQVIVGDDGVGLDDGGDATGDEDGQGDAGAATSGVGAQRSHTGLGNQIVRTLVANELNGTIDWRSRPEGGTQVIVNAQLTESVT